ncbi:MAG: radical SAM protein [Candidatus Omnitrophica bacterium]|nr:radical SAM protein [Candidatus Omnitrophota bacterium]
MDEISKIVSKYKLKRHHRDFDRVKLSSLKRKNIFLRMNFNRIIQSMIIVLQSPFICKYVAEGFLTSIRGKKNLLRSLEIAITYKCNASCKQCSCRLSYDPIRERTQKLTLEEIKNVIDQAVELGAFQFVINGGEPMLEEESVFSLLEYIKKNHGRYVHLSTNGTLLDEKKIERLKNYGLDSIEMGLDSAFADIHDNNRIKGSFEKILENIRNCRKYRIRVVLNTIFTNDKVKSDDIIYIFYLAKKLGCLLQITPCCLTGGFKNRLDMMLTPEAKLYFHWLLSKSINNRSDLYSSLTKIKCPAAREKIGLQPYGDIVSCPLIQISYGNIREKSLKDIQEEMLKNPYYCLKKTQGCLPSMSEEFIKKYLV